MIAGVLNIPFLNHIYICMCNTSIYKEEKINTAPLRCWRERKVLNETRTQSFNIRKGKQFNLNTLRLCNGVNKTQSAVCRDL